MMCGRQSRISIASTSGRAGALRSPVFCCQKQDHVLKFGSVELFRVGKSAQVHFGRAGIAREAIICFEHLQTLSSRALVSGRGAQVRWRFLFHVAKCS